MRKRLGRTLDGNAKIYQSVLLCGQVLMYLNHITLTTDHLRRSPRAEVSGETIARMSPWLEALIASGESAPLPVSSLSDYSAHAAVQDGALIITISGPQALGTPPLVSMGVAKRSRHGAAVWPLMTGPSMPPIAPGVARPAEPWAAVAIWPTAALCPDAGEWLGDLERCIAWSWLERNP